MASNSDCLFVLLARICTPDFLRTVTLVVRTILFGWTLVSSRRGVHRMYDYCSIPIKMCRDVFWITINKCTYMFHFHSHLQNLCKQYAKYTKRIQCHHGSSEWAAFSLYITFVEWILWTINHRLFSDKWLPVQVTSVFILIAQLRR